MHDQFFLHAWLCVYSVYTDVCTFNGCVCGKIDASTGYVHVPKFTVIL